MLEKNRRHQLKNYFVRCKTKVTDREKITKMAVGLAQVKEYNTGGLQVLITM